MTKQKLDYILTSLKGISYSEWKKLSMCINQYYENEACNQASQILLTDLDSVVKEYKHYSSTI